MHYFIASSVVNCAVKYKIIKCAVAPMVFSGETVAQFRVCSLGVLFAFNLTQKEKLENGLFHRLIFPLNKAIKVMFLAFGLCSSAFYAIIQSQINFFRGWVPFYSLFDRGEIGCDVLQRSRAGLETRRGMCIIH